MNNHENPAERPPASVLSTPANASDLMNADPMNPPAPSEVRKVLIAKAEENERINDEAYMKQQAETKAFYDRSQGIVNAESDVSNAAQGGKHGGRQGAPKET